MSTENLSRRALLGGVVATIPAVAVLPASSSAIAAVAGNVVITDPVLPSPSEP